MRGDDFVVDGARDRVALKGDGGDLRDGLATPAALGCFYFVSVSWKESRNAMIGFSKLFSWFMPCGAVFLTDP